MGKGRQIDASEKTGQLEAQIARQNTKIGTKLSHTYWTLLNRLPVKVETQVRKTKHKKLITRPKGQAGRGSIALAAAIDFRLR
jgi:hypothetical protein